MHDAEYTDQTGKREKYYMGCYGIGIGRTLAAIVEAHHDDKGIIWPANIAPYKVYLARLSSDESVVKKADELYEKLMSVGIEVLYDDREGVRAGEMFADADLIGLPWRLVISQRTVDDNKYELKARNEAQAQSLDESELIQTLAGK